jgi:hypothetical protein
MWEFRRDLSLRLAALVSRQGYAFAIEQVNWFYAQQEISIFRLLGPEYFSLFASEIISVGDEYLAQSQSFSC